MAIHGPHRFNHHAPQAESVVEAAPQDSTMVHPRIALLQARMNTAIDKSEYASIRQHAETIFACVQSRDDFTQFEENLPLKMDPEVVAMLLKEVGSTDAPTVLLFLTEHGLIGNAPARQAYVAQFGAVPAQEEAIIPLTRTPVARDSINQAASKLALNIKPVVAEEEAAPVTAFVPTPAQWRMDEPGVIKPSGYVAREFGDYAHLMGEGFNGLPAGRIHLPVEAVAHLQNIDHGISYNLPTDTPIQEGRTHVTMHDDEAALGYQGAHRPRSRRAREKDTNAFDAGADGTPFSYDHLFDEINEPGDKHRRRAEEGEPDPLARSRGRR